MSPKLTRAWSIRLQIRMGVFVALAALSGPEGVQAAENGTGVYILGSQGPAAGVLQPPGVYLQDDLYLYGGSANASKEMKVNGKIVAGVNADPATLYRTGTEWHFEGALIQHFSPEFDAGLVGYVYRQLTADTGAGAVLGPFEGRVSSLGLTSGYIFLAGKIPIATRVRVYRESQTANRLQGTATFLT